MPVRRIVTGIDPNGKSCFVFDGENPARVEFGIATTEEVWVDDPSSPDPQLLHDPAASERFHLLPPPGGSTFRVFTFMPASSRSDRVGQALKEAAARFDTGGVMEKEDPAMHTTKTIDYGIVLSGEIDLELDSGTVHLKPGDVVVQRATRHAWRNRGTAPCTMAFILIDSPNYR